MKTGETGVVTLDDGALLTVRRLGRVDRQALQRFDASLSAASRGTFLPHLYDDATVWKVLERSESGDDFTLGAFADDRLVGYVFLWRAREPVPLLGIGILDAWQHRGLGSQLMQILIREAKGTGREGIALTTMPENHAAFALYRRMGFEHYGEVENLAGDGRVVIERAMFYPINPGAQPGTVRHAPPV